MPGSTYSTNLKIELIPLGEQSGTWGTTTNTNMGTALEQAIVGYGNPNFTSDANLTISLTDSNASQTARSFALNVTSSVSLTATRELVVPTIQKPYLIYNNTSGSQSITVKTTAGSGVTVPNGARTLVYVDGTNVVSQITQLPTLTLATALAATSGGTGQSSYAVGDLLYASTTTALSKLADVATGNALLSGGVGVAPAWGQVGLTTHVTGTLPVANGGTGATSLTANNVILGNGTSAPQTVAPSTTGNVLTSNGTTWQSTAPSITSASPSVAKAWILHNDGTSINSFNCSISKVTTGTYTVTFTSALSSASYVILYSNEVVGYWQISSKTTSGFTVTTYNLSTSIYGGGPVDTYGSFAVFV